MLLKRYPGSAICVVCAIWNHSYNLKNVENTRRGVLLLLKLQAKACNFAKSNTFPRVFLIFLKLYKWYQIAHSISCEGLINSCFWIIFLTTFKFVQRIISICLVAPIFWIWRIIWVTAITLLNICLNVYSRFDSITKISLLCNHCLCKYIWTIYKWTNSRKGLGTRQKNLCSNSTGYKPKQF